MKKMIMIAALLTTSNSFAASTECEKAIDNVLVAAVVYGLSSSLYNEVENNEVEINRMLERDKQRNDLEKNVKAAKEVCN